jgi:hypothetical protein
MSAVGAPSSLWSTVKNVPLTGHSFHRHKPNPVSLGFKAPNPSLNLSFGPTALAAAIARTATLRNAPIDLLKHWRNAALQEVELMIAQGATFSLSPQFEFLADSERTSFASRVGSGVTDLMMNALGYTWRDNAACLSSSTLDPRADFIYAGGNALGHGVVLAEAHGSFASNVNNALIARRAKDKYLRQVRRYVATTSPHGPIIHGYSVAFGSKPGTASTYLNLAETQIRKTRPKASAPASTSSATPTSLAFATHRSNFLLMDAIPIVNWIDWANGTAETPDADSPIEFVRLPYAGKTFLACVDFLSPFGKLPSWVQEYWHDPRWWTHCGSPWLSRLNEFWQFAGWFVMQEQACEQFLNALSGMVRSGKADARRTLELPGVDPIGFGIGEGPQMTRDARPDYTYAMFRDGLALLGTPPRRIADRRVWRPRDGFA